MTLFIETLNILGRDNYGPDTPSVRCPQGIVTGLTQKLFPILPSAGVLVEF